MLKLKERFNGFIRDIETCLLHMSLKHLRGELEHFSITILIKEITKEIIKLKYEFLDKNIL